MLEDLSYATEGVSENFGALDKKIKGLIDKAKNAVKRGKYQEAIGYCDEGIKDIDTFKAGVKSGSVKSKAVKVVIGAVVSLLAVAATVMLVKKGKGKNGGKGETTTGNNTVTTPTKSLPEGPTETNDEPTGSGSNRRSVSRGTGKKYSIPNSTPYATPYATHIAEPVRDAKEKGKRTFKIADNVKGDRKVTKGQRVEVYDNMSDLDMEEINKDIRKDRRDRVRRASMQIADDVSNSNAQIRKLKEQRENINKQLTHLEDEMDAYEKEHPGIPHEVYAKKWKKYDDMRMKLVRQMKALSKKEMALVIKKEKWAKTQTDLTPMTKARLAQDSYLYDDEEEISMEAAIGGGVIDRLKGFLKGGSEDTNVMLSALDAAKASLANIKAQCQSMLKGKAAKESVLFSLESALEEAEYDSQDLFNDGILEYIFATENDSYLADLLELGLEDQIAYETYVDLTEI